MNLVLIYTKLVLKFLGSIALSKRELESRDVVKMWSAFSTTWARLAHRASDTFSDGTCSASVLESPPTAFSFSFFAVGVFLTLRRLDVMHDVAARQATVLASALPNNCRPSRRACLSGTRRRADGLAVSVPRTSCGVDCQSTSQRGAMIQPRCSVRALMSDGRGPRTCHQA